MSLKKCLLLILILIFSLNTPNSTYGKIVFNPNTNKIEMPPEDYKELIDTIREYEAMIEALKNQLLKERILFEEIKKSYEEVLKFDKEKMTRLMNNLDAAVKQRNEFYIKYEKEKTKNSTKNTIILGLILGLITSLTFK